MSRFIYKTEYCSTLALREVMDREGKDKWLLVCVVPEATDSITLAAHFAKLVGEYDTDEMTELLSRAERVLRGDGRVSLADEIKEALGE